MNSKILDDVVNNEVGEEASVQDYKENMGEDFASNVYSDFLSEMFSSDKVNGNESCTHIDLDSGDPLLEYEKIVSCRFATEDEAYQFFLAYSKEKRFSIRKYIVKYNTKDILVFRRFICSYAGFKRQREAFKREPRDSKRVGCPVLLAIRYDFGACNWYVDNFIDNHNHKLAATREEAVNLRSHRKIPEAHKTLLISMQRSGFRQCQAIRRIKEIHGGFQNLTYTRKDVYNFYDTERVRRIAKGDANIIVFFWEVVL